MTTAGGRGVGDRRPRVLVVDDDEALREMLAHALGEEGYEVLTAEDGAAALALLTAPGASTVPAVILTDLALPVMDAAAYLRAYRAAPGPHAPVICLSGGDPTWAGVRSLVDATLPKPFDLEELLALVAHWAHPAQEN